MNSPVNNDIKTWWVRFLPRTGKILGISLTPIKSSDKYEILETQNKLCSTAISTGTRKFIVRYSPLGNNYDICAKDNIINLSSLDFNLIPVRCMSPTNSAVHIEVRTYSHEIVVKLNKKIAVRDFGLSDIASLVYDNETRYFDIYIVSAGAPDKLLNTLSIDPLELFDKETLVFDISSIEQWCPVNQISILTRHIFDQYSYQYVSKPDINVTTHSGNISKVLFNAEADISIKRVASKELQISLGIDDAQLYKLDVISFLQIYVSDSIIDNITGSFIIDKDTLLQNGVVTTNFEIPETPIMIYRTNNLTMSYTGEQHV